MKELIWEYNRNKERYSCNVHILELHDPEPTGAYMLIGSHFKSYNTTNLNRIILMLLYPDEAKRHFEDFLYFGFKTIDLLNIEVNVPIENWSPKNEGLLSSLQKEIAKEIQQTKPELLL